MREDLSSYAEFWPVYLRAHSRAGNRCLHVIGTSLGLLLLASAIATADWRLVPTAVVVGYALAWAGHFFIEGNKPATFGHPLWSLISDFRMFGLTLAGRLDGELRKYGLSQMKRPPPE